MSWLTFIVALELGWMPTGTMIQYALPQPYAQYLAEWTYVEFEARGQAGPVFVEGRLKSTQARLDDDTATVASFHPDGMLYEVGGGLTWGPLTIGFRHMCTHPMMAYLPLSGGKPLWEGAYEEVYARLQLKWEGR